MTENNNPSITDIVSSTLQTNKNISNSNELEALKGLELAKIILKEFLDDKNLFSLSFLDNEQIDDIANAKILNTYYDIPEIDEYIDNILKLFRSNNGQAFRLLVKMVMFNHTDDDLKFGKRGFFERILKR